MALATSAVLGTSVLSGVGALRTSDAAAAPATVTSRAPVAAYWLVASDGGIFSFGGAPFYGSTGGLKLNKPIVGMARGPGGAGYWLDASDGGIFAFGDATFHGSMGGTHLNQPVVGMAATPDGQGYWLVARDGGVFAFGDAAFYGSMGGIHLNKPVVGMAATPDGKGYWLVASDGGIFAFGDAAFHGSTGSLHLNEPVVAMAAMPDGQGYWLVAADGGIFAFGDAGFHGSLGGVPQIHPVVAITSTPDGGGYWFTNTNGAVTSFGDAVYWGSAPQVLNQPVVGMAETAGTGNFTGSAYLSGSFGYDVSNYQCSDQPSQPHAFELVEAVGASFGTTNPCLAAEAAQAGAGLNLYAFLTFTTAPSSRDPACAATASPTACNAGFDAAVQAYEQAAAAGINTAVPWWLDVEGATTFWSTDTAANASLVQGAIDGLRSEGLNSVGIYASPGVWNSIVGDYQPAVPYWAASWQFDPGITCANVRSLFPQARLPTGPVQIVQYSSPDYPFALGGMSTLFDDDYAC